MSKKIVLSEGNRGTTHQLEPVEPILNRTDGVPTKHVKEEERIAGGGDQLS